MGPTVSGSASTTCSEAHGSAKTVEPVHPSPRAGRPGDSVIVFPETISTTRAEAEGALGALRSAAVTGILARELEEDPRASAEELARMAVEVVTVRVAPMARTAPRARYLVESTRAAPISPRGVPAVETGGGEAGAAAVEPEVVPSSAA